MDGIFGTRILLYRVGVLNSVTYKIENKDWIWWEYMKSKGKAMIISN